MTKPTGPQQYLLPNEEIRIVSSTQSGFLFMSNRRAVIMGQKGKSEHHIESAIPLDCILSFEPKKDDRLILSSIAVDEFGAHTKETVSFDLKVPDRDSIVNQCREVLDEIRSNVKSPPPPCDYSYLDSLPVSLTQNAILDLNTVLRDQPVHDELVYEAMKFLGDGPFLIEESLRDGNDRDNGVLFAAGTQGYYWIQGRKTGRFMQNVIVDTIDWGNIRCLAYPWQIDGSIIHASYSLTKGGKTVRSRYLWKPPIDDTTRQYPWLLQPSNGPWILSDVAYRYSGKSLPASMGKQRYYH